MFSPTELCKPLPIVRSMSRRGSNGAAGVPLYDCQQVRSSQTGQRDGLPQFSATAGRLIRQSVQHGSGHTGGLTVCSCISERLFVLINLALKHSICICI